MIALELTWTKLAVAAISATGGVFLLSNQLFWDDGHWKGAVEAELKIINAQFIKIDKRFDKLEGKIDQILPIIYRLEQKLLTPPKEN